MKDMDKVNSSDSNSAKETQNEASYKVTQPTNSPSPKLRNNGGFWKVAVIIAILVCLVLGVGITKLYFFITSNNRPVAERQVPTQDGNRAVTQEEEEIASVVDRVAPSVVSIVTKSGTTFYGSEAQEGAGTGIIVGKDGYILTNKHVVDGASTVNVILTDGTTYADVKVLGVDPLNDVAFLKIESGAKDLPAVDLGDSSSVRVGQKVVAIGNSLGQYQNTVTSGIISGTGRPVSAQAGDAVESLTDLLQTDAAINPGNSGGPLLNLKGQVIGINTAMIEGAQGIGFSIPINSTKGILKGVLAGKDVKRAYLGVSYIPITADVAGHYGLSVKKGAYVFSGAGKTSVVSGSPADKAGIKDKDIITKVGGIEVGDKGGVSSLIGEYMPGDTVELTILRGGKTISVKVTLASYEG